MPSQKYSSRKRKKELKKVIAAIKKAREVFDINNVHYDKAEWKKAFKALKLEKKLLLDFYQKYKSLKFRKSVNIKGNEITFIIESTGEYVVDNKNSIWLKCQNPKTDWSHDVRLSTDYCINDKWLKKVGIEIIEDDEEYSFQDKMQDFTDAFFEEAKEDGWYWNMD